MAMVVLSPVMDTRSFSFTPSSTQSALLNVMYGSEERMLTSLTLNFI